MTLLAQATEISVDVILVQEPALVDKKTKSLFFNQSYSWFGPLEDWVKDSL